MIIDYLDLNTNDVTKETEDIQNIKMYILLYNKYMKIIDIENWKGKKHYLWFKKYPAHYYSITTQIDITIFYQYIKANKLPFFIPFIYLLTKALNKVEEFRLRVVNDQVVLYDVIHPAYTVMTNNNVYDNCENQYDDDFKAFYQAASIAIEKSKQGIIEEKSYNDLSRLDQYYFSCLPWVDFTSVTHPMPNDNSAFVPRVVWGKYKFENEKALISLNIEVSHALIDGYPLSQGILNFQELVNQPEKYLKIR
jgi:chloramphenicol O-acetyltransferase type A